MDFLDDDKPFLWHAKYRQAGLDWDDEKIAAEARQIAEQNKIELQQIKERQRKRELEYQQKLQEGEFLQRQRELEQHQHWESQEDNFVLRQDKQRSKIRIRDGRAKPIDLFSHYIDVFGVKLDESQQDNKPLGFLIEEKIDLSESPVELLNPCDWFNGLRLADLESLEPDIKKYMDADLEENHEYWRDLLDICLNELSKLRQAAKQQQQQQAGTKAPVAVIADLVSLFEGKPIRELDQLEDEMCDIIESGDPAVDVAFYKASLVRLRAHRAKLRLTQNHKRNLARKKENLLDKKPPVGIKRETSEDEDERSQAAPKKRPTGPAEADEPPIVASASNIKSEPMDGAEEDVAAAAEDDVIMETEEAEDEDETAAAGEGSTEADAERVARARAKCIEEYERGNYSPKMLHKDEIDPGLVCVDYEKEYEVLAHLRRQVCNASSLDEAKKVTMTSEERAFIDVASKDMDSREESMFSCEAMIRGIDNRLQTYSWADKYKPRKPRYFNRVHTGFEWNKYNQTHYDVDNPPPKVVQGYKFNIFYPDLIDKSKAPTFTLKPCKEDKDFSVIRFSAGPPYEDIAFRIVNREWNNSHKSGYRCQFINNILQLWFQFKRYRYRR